MIAILWKRASLAGCGHDGWQIVLHESTRLLILV